MNTRLYSQQIGMNFITGVQKRLIIGEDDPNIVGGIDLEKGGTWLGLSTSGKLAALTNIRNTDDRLLSDKSRGEIVTSFLTNKNMFANILSNKASYQGFNLLYGSVNGLHYTSNQNKESIKLSKGVHVLSNGKLNEPWPKSEELKKGFNQLDSLSKKEVEAHLFKLLTSQQTFPDEQLPNTGVGIDFERKLAPIFIQTENYGTRCSTVILVDKDGIVTFVEKTYVPDSLVVKYVFPLKKS